MSTLPDKSLFNFSDEELEMKNTGIKPKDKILKRHANRL